MGKDKPSKCVFCNHKGVCRSMFRPFVKQKSGQPGWLKCDGMNPPEKCPKKLRPIAHE